MRTGVAVSDVDAVVSTDMGLLERMRRTLSRGPAVLRPAPLGESRRPGKMRLGHASIHSVTRP
ncbi:hypothetical protein GCM10009588_00030 [Microbacterium phyllosphaerae]